MIIYKNTTPIPKAYSYLTIFLEPLPDINDCMSFLVSSFVLDANSLPPPPLKNINVWCAFHVKKSSVKMNMLSMILYKLQLIKYLLTQPLSFILV